MNLQFRSESSIHNPVSKYSINVINTVDWFFTLRSSQSFKNLSIKIRSPSENETETSNNHIVEKLITVQ